MKRKLQITQNKVVRFILNYKPRTSVTVKDFENMRWLNVENRVKQLRLNHMYKIYYKKGPPYLGTNFVCSSDVRSYNTRSSNYNFIVPQCNSIMKQAFLYNTKLDLLSTRDDFVQYI